MTYAANLDDLADVCTGRSRYGFLLTITPPRTQRLTGVPVNPLAIL
jgi:hypothetical protein